MIRSLILSSFLLLFIAGAFAQDQIHLKSGNIVKVSIIGSDRDNVLCKSTNPADREVYEYPKAEIIMIEYEDGRKEYFDDPPEEVEIEEEEENDEEKFVEENEIPSESQNNEEIFKPLKRNIFYIGTFMGPSLPILKYGSSNGYDNGYAKTGWYFNLEAAMTFKSWFGMGLTIGGGQSPMRSNAVERKWELPELGNYESTTGHYSHFYLMLGPHVSVKNGSKLYIDVRFRYGFCITTEPAYNLTYKDSLNNTVVVDNHDDTLGITAISGSILSGSIGGMIRYNFSDRFGVALQLDWIFLPYLFDSKQYKSYYDTNGRLVDANVTTIEDFGIASMNYIGVGVYFNILKPGRR